MDCGIESERAPAAAVASAGHRRRNNDRAVGLFVAGGDVQRVQAMHVNESLIIGGWQWFLRPCHKVKRASGGLDDRRADNTNLVFPERRAAADIGGREGGDPGCRVNENGVPKWSGVGSQVAIGIEGIDAVMLGGNEHDIVSALARNG